MNYLDKFVISCDRGCYTGGLTWDGWVYRFSTKESRWKKYNSYEEAFEVTQTGLKSNNIPNLQIKQIKELNGTAIS